MDEPIVALPVIAMLGVFAPFVISLLKNANAPPLVNQVVALVVCFLFAALSVGLTGGFVSWTAPDIIAAAGAIFVVAQSIYRLFFSTSLEPLNERLESVLWGPPRASPEHPLLE